MPYLFFEVERQKNSIIWFLFSLLVTLYFLCAFTIWFIVKGIWPAILEDNLSKINFQPLITKEILAILIFSFCIALIHWIFSQHQVIEKILSAINAEPLNPADKYHQLLKNTIEEASVACGGIYFESYVIPSANLNAFSIADFSGRKVVGVTEGLLAKLNRGEIQAVVGHEIAHILNGDSLFMTVSSSLFELYSAILKNLSESSRRSRDTGSFDLLVYVVFILVFVFERLSYFINISISREREYRADAVSVRVTRDPLSLAHSLYLISKNRMTEKIKSTNLSSIFIISPRYKNLEEQEGFLADLLSTHPPIKKRIEILLAMAGIDLKTLENMDSGVKIKPNKPANNEINEFKQSFRPSEQSPSSKFSCPICFQYMEELDYEGNIVGRCAFCRGLFLKRIDLLRVIIRNEESFSKELIKNAESIIQNTKNYTAFPLINKSNLIECPQCHKKMQKMYFSWSLDVGIPEGENILKEIEPLYLVIDKCTWCDFVWLDRNKLEVIQYIYERYQ